MAFVREGQNVTNVCSLDSSFEAISPPLFDQIRQNARTKHEVLLYVIELKEKYGDFLK